MTPLLDTPHDALLMLMPGDAVLWQIIRVSLETAGLALLIATPVAIVIGYGLVMHSFPGRRIVVWLSQTALSLPAVLIGLLLYLMLSRQEALGIVLIIVLALGINAALMLLQGDAGAPRRAG